LGKPADNGSIPSIWLPFCLSKWISFISRIVCKHARSIFQNEGFFRDTQFSKAEILGKTTIELKLWERLEQSTEFVNALQKEQRVLNIEAQFRNKSGALFTGLISGETIQLQGQNCVLSVIHDINERKLAEEALRQSEAELGPCSLRCRMWCW
jgi:PAS domain S-box-containing protein